MRAMRRLWPLLVLATALAACASAPRVRDESVRALRRPGGVCAGTSYLNPAGRPVLLQGCLRVGSAGTAFDNLEARLVTELDARDPDDADLTDWQVQLIRDGEQLLNRALDAGPSHRRCPGLMSACRERTADVALLAGGLEPGTYTIRYRLMSEEAFAVGRQPAELTIVLR